MVLQETPRPLLRAATAGVLVVLLALPVPGLRVAAALLLVGLLPGLALTARSPSGWSPAIALAVSPILFGFAALAMVACAIQPYAAGRIAAVLWAALFVALPPRRATEKGPSMRTTAGLVLVAAVAAALVFTLPLSETWWRVREDSWFHAAVFERLVHHGLPLVDPYFTPLRLQYGYFYHVVLAGMAGLTGLDAFHAMVAVNALALAGCVAAFDRFARSFSPRTAPRVLGAGLVLFGMNGWFFLFYPLRLARAWFGATHGAFLLSQFFPWSPNGVGTAARLLSIQDNQVLFLDKFMVGTALSLGFGLVCLVLALLIRGRWSRWHDVLWTVVLAGLLYVHLVLGLAVLAATLVVLALLAVVRSRSGPRGAPEVPSPARLFVLALVSVAAAVPYIYSAMPRDGGGASFHFAVQPAHLVGFVSDVLPALVLAVPLFWRGRRGGRDIPDDDRFGGRIVAERGLTGTGILVAWALVVGLIAVFVDLPTTNETKFYFPLHIVLAALAVGGIDRLWRNARHRAGVLALLATCTIPLNGIYFYQAFRDPTRFVETDAERAVYEWIQRETPLNAVFIEDDDIVRIPVLAARDQYWGTETYAHNWEYPPAEIARRRALRDTIFAEGRLSPDQIDALRALDRPVYVVCRGILADHRERFERLQRDPLFRKVFLKGDLAVFQARLAGHDGKDSNGDPDSGITQPDP